MAQQIICDHCMSNVELGAQSCPYCGKRFVNTNPAGALPAHSLLAGRYTKDKGLTEIYTRTLPAALST